MSHLSKGCSCPYEIHPPWQPEGSFNNKWHYIPNCAPCGKCFILMVGSTLASPRLHPLWQVPTLTLCFDPSKVQSSILSSPWPHLFLCLAYTSSPSMWAAAAHLSSLSLTVSSLRTQPTDTPVTVSVHVSGQPLLSSFRLLKPNPYACDCSWLIPRW